LKAKVKRLKFFLKRRKKKKEKREKRNRQYSNKNCRTWPKSNKKKCSSMKPSRILRMSYKTRRSASDWSSKRKRSLKPY